VAHQTVRCAIRQKPSPTTNLVVGAINTPQPPHFIASKFSAIKHHTRALDFIPRHKQRDRILSQVQTSFQDTNKEIESSPKSGITPNKLVTREKDFCVLLSFCAWITFLLPISCSQDHCNQSKRHQLCGGPCGDLVSRLIEKRSSLGLVDRLREGNG
jgi:hypothetical protein